MSNQIAFTGEKYKANGVTWTSAYDQWRRDNHICNSPRAWAGLGRKMLHDAEMEKLRKAWNDRPWWRKFLNLPPAPTDSFQQAINFLRM